MPKKLIIVGVSLLSMAFAAPVLAEDGYGAAYMVLQGGSQGNVGFPHKLHQDKLDDCDACHKLFPQEAGAIQKLIAAGTLKKKQVMERCKSCHQETKDKGHTAGPTSCDACHDK
jgi:cytochrome c-type protein NrfB